MEVEIGAEIGLCSYQKLNIGLGLELGLGLRLGLKLGLGLKMGLPD